MLFARSWLGGLCDLLDDGRFQRFLWVSGLRVRCVGVTSVAVWMVGVLLLVVYAAVCGWGFVDSCEFWLRCVGLYVIFLGTFVVG